MSIRFSAKAELYSYLKHGCRLTQELLIQKPYGNKGGNESSARGIWIQGKYRLSITEFKIVNSAGECYLFNFNSIGIRNYGTENEDI